MLLRTCRKTRLLSNEFRWIRRRTINRSLSRCPFTRSCAFFLLSLSLFLNNKSKISNFIFFSFLLSQITVDAWSDLRTTPKRQRRKKPDKEGLERGLRSARYRWSRPDADRETTRGLPDPFVGLIPRQTPAISRSNVLRRSLISLDGATDPATSTSSTPRGRTITW